LEYVAGLFAEAAEPEALRIGSFHNYDEEYAKEFITGWRDSVLRYLDFVISNRARTVKVALQQNIKELVSPEEFIEKGWKEFALLLDADSILEELESDKNIKLTWAESQLLDMRVRLAHIYADSVIKGRELEREDKILISDLKRVITEKE